MKAKASRTYEARQDIVWALPAEQGGGMMEIITQTARAGIHSRTTYLFPPDAAGRVMTDDGMQTSLYEPRLRTLLVQPSTARDMAQDLPPMLALLHRNYRCVIVRHERVNDRACAVVALCPRAAGGPLKLLWIDTQKPFILRLEEHDADGSRSYVSSYDSIRFPAHLTAGALSPPPEAKSVPRRTLLSVNLPLAMGAAQVETAAGFPVTRPAWIPCGYALVRVSLLTQPLPAQKMVQLRYSDGLKTMTVLQCRAMDMLPPAAALNGTLSRYGQQAWAQDTGRMRTIVRSDLSLPPAVGREMLLALAPQTEARLLRGIAQDFGQAVRHNAAGLRHAGWDYVQIASLALYLHLNPKNTTRAQNMIAQKCAWLEVARRLHADTLGLETQARVWITQTLGQE